MEFDAFSNNIEPGGLRSITEIKILLCYLLTSVHSALSRGQINEIVSEYGLANFFEVNAALDSLSDSGVLIQPRSDVFIAGDKAKVIAADLDVTLPYTVRSQAVEAASKLLLRVKRNSENTAVIIKNEKGYTVSCKVEDLGVNLMNLEIFVGDILQAEKVREGFISNASDVYKSVISHLTGTDEP